MGPRATPPRQHRSLRSKALGPQRPRLSPSSRWVGVRGTDSCSLWFSTLNAPSPLLRHPPGSVDTTRLSRAHFRDQSCGPGLRPPHSMSLGSLVPRTRIACAQNPLGRWEEEQKLPGEGGIDPREGGTCPEEGRTRLRKAGQSAVRAWPPSPSPCAIGAPCAAPPTHPL